MKFSEHFKIRNNCDEDWFDPILTSDTKLFIDPFLVFKSDDPLFHDVYDRIMEFFNQVFKLIAQSNGNKKSPHYKKAVSLLQFHEVNEVCLGYSPTRTGSGPGIGRSKILANNIQNCINAGILRLTHFEEIGIFSEGIGRDHISDMTANLMKDRLIEYTQDICTELEVPMEQFAVRNGLFDKRFLRWEHPNVLLPRNQYKNTGVLLVPKKFLKEMPEINADDFYQTILENQNLRDDLNFEIDRRLKKGEIARIALANADLVQQYINIVEKRPSNPYDISKDPSLRYKWYDIAEDIVKGFEQEGCAPNNEKEFYLFVEETVQNFKTFVELNSGYKLLWDDDFRQSKSEEAVQLLFHGVVNAYCKANDIDLTREVNQGRGPVDFRFSNGYRKRIVLEIKLAKNGKFWNGLEKQLPLYLGADSCRNGVFLVVLYTENDAKRIRSIQERLATVNEANKLQIKTVIVDAMPAKPSASNL